MDKGKDDDPLINEALGHLDEAERDRAKARELRAEAEALDAKVDAEAREAERDLEKAKGNGGGDEDDDDVKVRFRHLAEHDEGRRGVALIAELQKVDLRLRAIGRPPRLVVRAAAAS